MNYRYKKWTDEVDLAEITGVPLTAEEATALNLTPLSELVEHKCEHYILYNMILDMKAANINHALVKEKNGITLWRSTWSGKI